MQSLRRSLLTLVLAMLLVAPGMRMALAEPNGMIHLQLNKLEPGRDGCQTHVVLHNDRARDLQSIKLELVVFDADGVVNRNLVLPFSSLPPDKTKHQAFVLDGLSCDRIGRILVNDVRECTDQEGPVDGCLGLLALTSLAEAPFIK